MIIKSISNRTNPLLFCTLKCCAVAVVCLLGVNIASGASCEGDDDEIPLCQFEVLASSWKCRVVMGTECTVEWDWDLNAFTWECTNYFHDRCVRQWKSITVWVAAETEEERRDRIALFADARVREGVQSLREACEATDNRGSRESGLSRRDCRRLDEAYTGLTTRVGSYLSVFKNEILNDRSAGEALKYAHFKYDRSSTTGTQIRIDVREIEEKYEFDKFQRNSKDLVIVDAILHERIHLADWSFHRPERFHWVGLSIKYHNTAYNAKYDRTYQHAKRLTEQIGTVGVNWSQDCNPYNPLFWLRGWGHVLEDLVEEQGPHYHYVYCLIKDKIRL